MRVNIKIALFTFDAPHFKESFWFTKPKEEDDIRFHVECGEDILIEASAFDLEKIESIKKQMTLNYISIALVGKNSKRVFIPLTKDTLQSYNFHLVFEIETLLNDFNKSEYKQFDQFKRFLLSLWQQNFAIINNKQ